MPVNFGGAGVLPSLGALPETEIVLQSGAVYNIPSGRWECKPGIYSTIQEYDPITQIWRSIGGGPTDGAVNRIVSDGANYRFANQTGCPVGALVTTAGTGYTTAPTVTAGAGGSLWRAIVGGAVNTSVTVSAGGSNYTYPPLVIFAPPPPGGVPATGYCTLTTNAVSSVTVVDQGAGYTTAPTITFLNDPREGVNGITAGSGAVGVASLTGSGSVTAVVCIDHGQGGQTSVPSLTFSSGSAAATAIMCWSITAYTVSATTAGSGYVAPVLISAYGGFPATSPSYTNVTIQKNLVKTRNAFILGALSTGAMTATGQTVFDGGIYAGAPTVYVQSAGVSGAGPVQTTFTAPSMGGQQDICLIWPT